MVQETLVEWLILKCIRVVHFIQFFLSGRWNGSPDSGGVYFQITLQKSAGVKQSKQRLNPFFPYWVQFWSIYLWISAAFNFHCTTFWSEILVLHYIYFIVSCNHTYYDICINHICVFAADPEELCGGDGFSLSHCQPSGAQDALLQRAHAAEERARHSEEALARAMEDLYKLKSVTFLYLHCLYGQYNRYVWTIRCKQMFFSCWELALALVLVCFCTASRGPQWTPYCRNINCTLWQKFGGRGKK